MSVMSYNSRILLYTFIVIASSVELGYASPTRTVVKDDPIIESLEEINDLNKNIILRDSTSMETSEPIYTHRDQDTIDNERLSTILGKLKNDVEILESNESGKNEDGSEIEERYRGPSIVINTDEFINENIEMNAEDEAEERADKEALATSHTILSIILVVVALLSIGLYAALVMWRSHIEQRYGMRELLVTSDNQDYWPQHMTDAAIPSHFQAQQQQQQQQQQQNA